MPKIEIGDKVRTSEGSEGIVRFIGDLHDSGAPKGSYWSEWGESNWNGIISPRSSGGRLSFSTNVTLIQKREREWD
jgi:hypothetical protein